ncbi:M20/M25/M40 family metallo-hydrolase [candidate division KSB1 bacterium]|nr:M20/M25/M40 family metallo-hydrolase [candidate division KSB1 bacterium]
MKRFFHLGIIALSVMISACSQHPELTVDELEAHLEFLASDALKGRLPGTLEDQRAAQYIKEEITARNVELLGQDGFQTFEIVSSIESGESNSANLNGEPLVFNQDYAPYSFSENGSLTAPIVFAGYGFHINTDSLTWLDYDNLDVAGKWVLILRGDPELNEPNSHFAPYSTLRKKVFVAKDFGVAGVIFVSGGIFDDKDELPELIINDSHISVGIPVIHLKKHKADRLLAAKNITVDSLETWLNSEQRPRSFPLETTCDATVSIQKVKKPTQNVLAVLPGSDPALKDEYIVLGAHYDHLGLGGPGTSSRRPDTLAIHNGADDNASGITAILEIFEKFVAEHKNLRRSILFIAFGAEEMGTLGSRYFVEHPLVDLAQIKFMFNFDMVGRLESNALTLYGTGTAIGLEDILKTYAKRYGFELTMSPEGLGPSDHAPFYAADIPVLMFFTGLHDDYHTPDDDAYKINYQGEKRVADFAYDVIFDIANQDKSLVFQEAGPKERYTSRRPFKVTLGIMPDVAGAEKRGLRVDAVMPDRPAQRAGMQKGDIIVAMDGKPVKDVYEYMHRLSNFQVGQRISVEVLRGDDKVILIVEL